MKHQSACLNSAAWKCDPVQVAAELWPLGQLKGKTLTRVRGGSQGGLTVILDGVENKGQGFFSA